MVASAYVETPADRDARSVGSQKDRTMRIPFSIAPAMVVVLLGMTGCSGARDTHDPNFVELTHWATQETKYNQVKIGMNKKAVLSLMGVPNRKYRLTEEDREEWSYEFPRGEGHIVIDFDRNGTVVVKQFGYC